MKIGDHVRIHQPSLLDPEHKRAPRGVIVRMPIPPGKPKRVDDARVMVRCEGLKRPRPVRPEHLVVIQEAATHSSGVFGRR